MKVAAVLTLALLAPLVLVIAPLGGRSEQACSRRAWDIRGDRSATANAEALGAEQLRNASVIVGEAIRRGHGDVGAVIGVMAALTESSLRNLDHGDSAGPDSRGLFQQRAGWGSLSIRMSPAGATELFFDGLESVPNWREMPPWMAAQAVQRSAFSDGSNYRHNYATAVEVVGHLLNTPITRRRTVAMSSDACRDASTTSVAATVRVPPPPAPYEGGNAGCVVPDPTGTGGCVTAATAHLLRESRRAFPAVVSWGVSCWDEHAWSPNSDHPLGRACDFTVGQLGSFPTDAQTHLGWSLAVWLRVSAKRLRVDYVIWDGRIWSQERSDEGWRRYDGGGIYDVSSPTGGHHDHIHASTTQN